MSVPRVPDPAQLVLSVLSAGRPKGEAAWPGLLARLEDRLGPADLVTEPVPFEHTDYYDGELGRPIVRRVLGFERLVPQDGLADIKYFTNRLEAEYARPDGRRTVNLDPGLVTQERVVLATGKNFPHRVYLQGGIWADLTLVYKRGGPGVPGGWQDLEWTFPDYRTREMKAVMTRLRDMYRAKLAARKQP